MPFRLRPEFTINTLTRAFSSKEDMLKSAAQIRTSDTAICAIGAGLLLGGVGWIFLWGIWEGFQKFFNEPIKLSGAAEVSVKTVLSDIHEKKIQFYMENGTKVILTEVVVDDKTEVYGVINDGAFELIPGISTLKQLQEKCLNDFVQHESMYQSYFPLKPEASKWLKEIQSKIGTPDEHFVFAKFFNVPLKVAGPAQVSIKIALSDINDQTIHFCMDDGARVTLTEVIGEKSMDVYGAINDGIPELLPDVSTLKQLQEKCLNDFFQHESLYQSYFPLKPAASKWLKEIQRNIGTPDEHVVFANFFNVPLKLAGSAEVSVKTALANIHDRTIRFYLDDGTIVAMTEVAVRRYNSAVFGGFANGTLELIPGISSLEQLQIKCANDFVYHESMYQAHFPLQPLTSNRLKFLDIGYKIGRSDLDKVAYENFMALVNEKDRVDLDLESRKSDEECSTSLNVSESSTSQSLQETDSDIVEAMFREKYLGLLMSGFVNGGDVDEIKAQFDEEMQAREVRDADILFSHYVALMEHIKQTATRWVKDSFTLVIDGQRDNSRRLIVHPDWEVIANADGIHFLNKSTTKSSLILANSSSTEENRFDQFVMRLSQSKISV